jgi:hypothetical protein
VERVIVRKRDRLAHILRRMAGTACAGFQPVAISNNHHCVDLLSNPRRPGDASLDAQGAARCRLRYMGGARGVSVPDHLDRSHGSDNYSARADCLLANVVYPSAADLYHTCPALGYTRLLRSLSVRM